MLNKLDAMVGFHQQVLNLREQRQQILAANVANSDTPNYQARDIDFKAELSKVVNQDRDPTVTPVNLLTTSQQHLHVSNTIPINHNMLYRVPYQVSADGNTVDMDQERTEFMDNSIHYQSSLTFLSEQFKNLMSVLQQG